MLALWLLGLVTSYTLGGVALMILGFNATSSFSSDVSRFFTGSATNNAVWMLMGGIFAATVGMLWTRRSWKQA
jgi:hypothetical protein